MSLLRLYVRAAVLCPSRRGLFASLAVGGCLGALYPPALLGEGTGVGLVGGLLYGLAGGLVVGLVALPWFVAMVAGADYALGVARDLHLVRVPAQRRAFAVTSASIYVGLRTMTAAAAAGAVVGLGAALRNHLVVGTVPGPRALLVVLLVVELSVLCAAGTFLSGRALAAYSTLVGGFVLVLAVLPFSGAPHGVVRWLLSATPQGSCWASAYQIPGTRFSTPMPRMVAVCLDVIYIVAAISAVWAVLRNKDRAVGRKI